MAAEAEICGEKALVSIKNRRSGSSPREKFEAAVNVIQGLPKNAAVYLERFKSIGSFQPSREMMLRFYAYYKQATLGPCNIPQPWAWDVVARAKWESWNSLGEMVREDAMLRYVNELKQVLPEDRSKAVGKIIETMPQTDHVAEFIEKLGSFYEIVDESDEPVSKEVVSRKPAFEGIEKLMAKAEIHLNGNGVESESDSEADSEKGVDKAEVGDTIGHHRIIVTPDYSSQDSGVGVLQSAEVVYLPYSEPDLKATSKKSPKQDAADHSPARINGDNRQRTLPAISSDTDSEAEFCDSTDHIQLPRESADSAVHSQRPLNHSRTDFVHSSTSINGPVCDAIFQRGGGETQNSPGDRRPSDRNRSSATRRPQNQQPMPDQTYLGTPPPLPVGATGGTGGEYPGRGGASAPSTHIDPQIAATLLRLQQDMNHILIKLNTLETHVLRDRGGDEVVHRQLPGSRCWWWPFGNLPARTVVAILAWPVVLQLLFKLYRLIQRRKRK